MLTKQMTPPVMADRYETNKPKMIPNGKNMKVNNSFLLVKFMLSSPNKCASNMNDKNNMLMNPQMRAMDKSHFLFFMVLFFSIEAEG
jgi:hypothetical protein